jgi:hypothetical protein
MTYVIIYLAVLLTPFSLQLIQSEPRTSSNLPSIEEVKDFLKGRWYITNARVQVEQYC